MSQPLSRSQYYPQKGFLDESASQTSSTLTCRLTRKQDERHASRRSSKNSSDTSLENIDIGKFYVRMSLKEEKTQQPLRLTQINRTNEGDRLKRRSPTPAQSKKGNHELKTKDEQNQLDTQLAIIELERKYNCEKTAKEILQKKLTAIENQLKNKMKNIVQLQKMNVQLTEKQKTAVKKLQQLQQMASINQINLNEARCSLEKLKGIIKKNRCQELEIDNNKLRKENGELKNSLSRLTKQANQYKELTAQLENDLKIFKLENERLIKGVYLQEKNQEIAKLKHDLTTSKSQKEEELERLIMLKNENQMRLRLKLEKMEIQVAYLNRKKNEEIQNLKVKNGQLLGKMRSKLCVLRDQLCDIKEQNEKLKRNPFPQQRRSLLLTDHRPTDEFFLFDLSP